MKGWYYFEVEPAESPLLNNYVFRHLCKTWLKKFFLDGVMSAVIAS